ncbi:hypothetical protein VCHC17A1_1401B, partial [Vibrio cholerae HC-17A1]
SDH